MPFLEALAAFRDEVRAMLRDKKEANDIFALCDRFRDVELVELGVRLEDRPKGQKALIKLDSRETLIRERQEKIDVRKLLYLR